MAPAWSFHYSCSFSVHVYLPPAHTHTHVFNINYVDQNLETYWAKTFIAEWTGPNLGLWTPKLASPAVAHQACRHLHTSTYKFVRHLIPSMMYECWPVADLDAEHRVFLVPQKERTSRRAPIVPSVVVLISRNHETIPPHYTTHRTTSVRHRWATNP